MNTNARSSSVLAEGIASELNQLSSNRLDAAICPPFVYLQQIAKVISSSNIALGAQDVYYESDGAFTGQISCQMLKDIGCTYVIIGHSERRQYFGETGETVDKKVQAALQVSLKPIMCVGETLEENEAGKTETVLARQVIASSDRLYYLGGLVIAYEPIWAIGTGRSATGEEANQTIGFIRQVISHKHGNDIADSVRILYGGSVTAENIAEFMKQPEIDGALVGGASLKADEFLSIA